LRISKIGTTSITIKTGTWGLRHSFGKNYDYIKVTEGYYTYVHIDEKRQPHTIERR
jgi:acyl-CoA hydrolase